MEMTYTSKNRELTVHLQGELDHHAARGALVRLEELTEQNLPRKLTLDLAGLSFMDSSGIAVVIRAKRRMETLGGSLAVTNIPRQAARVLETAGLDKYLNLSLGGEA